MFFLNKKQLKPALIFLSVIFLPGILVLLFAHIVYFEKEIFLSFLLTLVIYLLLTFVFVRISQSKAYYLILHENKISIFYPNINNFTGRLEIYNDKIKQFDYYKISSIKGWLKIFTYTFPKCVYITYENNGKEATELIGYFDYIDIKKIATDRGIKLFIH